MHQAMLVPNETSICACVWTQVVAEERSLRRPGKAWALSASGLQLLLLSSGRTSPLRCLGKGTS